MSTYQPKGTMCISCMHQKENCSGLPFSEMRVIETYNNVHIVKCGLFKKKEPRND